MYIVNGTGTDDTNQNSNLRRVFYNIQLDDTHFVDVMISEESDIAYTMKNEDGSTVYDSEGNTDMFFLYSELEAINLAIKAYEKEYGKTSVHIVLS